MSTLPFTVSSEALTYIEDMFRTHHVENLAPTLGFAFNYSS